MLGSGTDDEDLRKAIYAGINIVHIHTELRAAERRGADFGDFTPDQNLAQSHGLKQRFFQATL